MNPNTFEIMKSILFPGVAVALLTGAAWINAVPSSAREKPSQVDQVRLPVGRDVTVTLDPIANSKPVFAGDANVITGFNAPDVVKGIIVQMDDRWLVLQDGSAHDWVPLEKVLMIHASD